MWEAWLVKWLKMISVFFAVCERIIGTRIIFSNGYLIVLCFNIVLLPLKGVVYPSVIVFMIFGFIFIFSIYPLVIRVDKKERTQNYDPNYPNFGLFIILTTWFYFIFVDFGVDRVESIGYLIKWKKWMMTLEPLADMDHWENWKIKSIHPTSILEIRFDDQLIVWYFDILE